MTQHFRAVVIGGGVVGCSVLYHLSKAGWNDVALCERYELTAGATWHSSGHISAFTPTKTLCDLAMTTRRLLRALETESGQMIGLVDSGSLRLARSPEQLAEYETIAEMLNPSGLDTSVLGATETSAMWPLMKADDVYGALYLPHDCYLNAADLTQAYAKAARGRGARIFRNTGVDAIEHLPSGEWRLETTDGVFACEHVVSATGIFARNSPLSRYFTLPCATISHQYVVTAPIEEIRHRHSTDESRLPILRQPDIKLNIREEGEGLFVSVYEPHATAIFPQGPPPDFAMQLLPPDFTCIEEQFGSAIDRVACLGDAGIKDPVNGPMPWSPDFAPLVGPAQDLPNAWLAEANSYGVTWSGGVGELLANWITSGDPGRDAGELDPRRFDRMLDHRVIDEQATLAYQGSYNGARTR